MFYRLFKMNKFEIFCLKVVIILMLTINSLFPGDYFDQTKQLKVDITYGYGNYFSAFEQRQFADESYYNEVMINIERNVYKKFELP